MGNGLCGSSGNPHAESAHPPPHPQQAPSSSNSSDSSTAVPRSRSKNGSLKGPAAGAGGPPPARQTSLRPITMAPTEGHRKAAEELKAGGNALFQKGKYAAAIEKYTEAITLCPDLAVLYVNRAMCHKKRSDWPNVATDAAHALQLERDLMKGHYLRGLAYGAQRQYDLAIKHLQKALEAAREQNDAIKDEIWHELAAASYGQYEKTSAERKAAHAALRAQLASLLAGQQQQQQQGNGSAAAPPGGGGAAAVQQLPPAWEELFTLAAKHDVKAEAPSLLTCPLTMEIFRDPVCTPSGRSYERSALLDHLKRVGKFEPVTRQAMTEADVVTNLSLRSAVEQFLEEHPWAWGEVK